MELNPSRILLVEDAPDLAEPILIGLAEEGFSAEWAKDGRTAIRRLNEYWDLIILDLNLPDIPGESILSNLAQLPDYPAVLVLSARGTVQDKLTLFRQGCDDYLTKPFIFEELIERIRALLRRSQRVRTALHSYEDLNLDPTTHQLTSADGSTQLTPKESTMIQTLMLRPNQVVSRREILYSVWGLKDEPDTNFIGVHLHNLRKKLAEVNRAQWLITIRSSGFALCKTGNVPRGS